MVEGNAANIELAVVERGAAPRFLTDEEVEALVAEVEADKAAAAPQRGGGGAAAQQ